MSSSESSKEAARSGPAAEADAGTSAGGNAGRPRVWVSTTYFAEGFPYSVVNNIAEIMFAELGAGLRVIGMTALFHLPWNLKFLWGPFVDRFETKRRWLIAVEVALTALLLVLAFVATAGPTIGILAAVFVLLAFLAATHDIAIDGFYLEGLDAQGQSRFVGYRAMAYKVASLLVRGPLLMIIGWIGWTYGLLAITAVMLALTVTHIVVLPRVEARGRPLNALFKAMLRGRTLLGAAIVGGMALLGRELPLLGEVVASVSGLSRISVAAGIGTLWKLLRELVASVPGLSQISAGGWISLGLLAALVCLLALRGPLRRRLAGSNHYYGRAYLDFLDQRRVGLILAFVVLFRAGESFLQKMKWPFLRDQVGLSLEYYGFVNGTLGVLASFAGTFAGGWLIARSGLRRWIWPFVLAQNILNLLYVGLDHLSQSGPPAMGVVTAVITVEHFGEGLGTAVFMVYLMRCCDPAHKAAHMAILTALMSVSFTIAGVASGFMAEAWGFGTYFAFCFAATLPGMVLIPLLPYLDGRTPTSKPAA